MTSDQQLLSLPPFPSEYRASGLLLHITSLPSAYGIGDVGPSAFSWLRSTPTSGPKLVAGAASGPTGYGNSPYQSLSSFAGNELLISPESLIEDGLLQANERLIIRTRSPSITISSFHLNAI